MGVEILAEKVGENVFPAKSLFCVYFDAARRGENFTLTGLDSKGSAEESAELIVKSIRDIFKKKYACSVEADRKNYRINCSLNKNGK